MIKLGEIDIASLASTDKETINIRDNLITYKRGSLYLAKAIIPLSFVTFPGVEIEPIPPSEMPDTLSGLYEAVNEGIITPMWQNTAYFTTGGYDLGLTSSSQRKITVIAVHANVNSTEKCFSCLTNMSYEVTESTTDTGYSYSIMGRCTLYCPTRDLNTKPGNIEFDFTLLIEKVE